MKEELIKLGEKFAETTLQAKSIISKNFKKVIKNEPV
jgi:hypothetical protein